MEEDLLLTIHSTHVGKSPGLKGYTPKIHKAYIDHLTPFLLKVFNYISTENQFLAQSLEAHDLETCKDHAMCINYYLISLIEVDLKIYIRLIVSDLQPLLLKNDTLRPGQVCTGRDMRLTTTLLSSTGDMSTAMEDGRVGKVPSRLLCSIV